MIKDPVLSLQPNLVAFLREQAGARAPEANGEIDRAVAWRPHVLERDPLRGWYFHFDTPESDWWLDRVRRAKIVAPGLRVGVAASIAVLGDEKFLDACDEVGASIALIRERRGEWMVEAIYNAVPDLICERRVKLNAGLTSTLLDRWLARALREQNDQRKGVLLEVVVALLLSQVENFEVRAVGVSNRTQQMDVLVHNKNAVGAFSNSPVVLAEAKNWPRRSVSPTEYAEFLRKLESRHGRAKLGYLITTGKFTRGVADERRRDSKQDTLVVLVDGKALPLLWRGRSDVNSALEAATIDATIGA